MQRLLITGGSGYLGAELVRQALAGGAWDVTATYHTRALTQPGAQFVALDLHNRADVRGLVDALRPAAIIHTAYVRQGAGLQPVTAQGAGFIAEAAQQCGARLIHVSSDALFDGEHEGVYADDAPPSPITPYGAAKAEAERLVAAAHPAALIARTSLIYGGVEPSDHERLALDAAAGRADIAFFTDEIRNPVQVGDLARALLALLGTDARGVLNVAGAEAVSRAAFAQLVVAAHGRAPERLRFARSADSGVRRPRNCALDSSAAQQLLAHRLRGVREVLQGEQGTG